MGKLLSRQGVRERRRFVHNGIDIGGDAGTPFYPVAPGVVAAVCPSGNYRCSGYGNAVLVKHDDDLYSWYAHMDRVDVAEGMPVAPALAPLGTIGTTFGTPEDPNRRLAVPHIHMELLHAGWPFGARDYAARYDVLGLLASSGWGIDSTAHFAQVEPYEYHEEGYQRALAKASDESLEPEIAPSDLVYGKWYTIGLPLLAVAGFGLSGWVVYKLLKENS